MFKRAFTIRSRKPLVFGVALAKLAKREARGGKGAASNAVLVPRLVQFLAESLSSEDYIYTEGIFRISANAREVKECREAIDAGADWTTLGLRERNVHVAAALLKMFFRELPIGLVPEEYFDAFCEASAAETDDQEQEQQRLCRAVGLLPDTHQHTLAYLLAFLGRVAAHSNVNKMDAANLGLLFGPNVLRSSRPLQDTHTLIHAVMQRLLAHSAAIGDDVTRRHFPAHAAVALADEHYAAAQKLGGDAQVPSETDIVVMAVPVLEPNVHAKHKPAKLVRKQRSRSVSATSQTSQYSTASGDPADAAAAATAGHGGSDSSNTRDLQEVPEEEVDPAEAADLSSAAANDDRAAQSRSISDMGVPLDAFKLPVPPLADDAAAQRAYTEASPSIILDISAPEDADAEAPPPILPVEATSEEVNAEVSQSISLAPHEHGLSLQSSMDEVVMVPLDALNVSTPKGEGGNERESGQQRKKSKRKRNLSSAPQPAIPAVADPQTPVKRSNMSIASLASPLTPNSPVVPSPLRNEITSAAAAQDTANAMEIDFSKPVSELSHEERKQLRRHCRQLRKQIASYKEKEQQQITVMRAGNQESSNPARRASLTMSSLKAAHRSALERYQRLRRYLEQAQLPALSAQRNVEPSDAMPLSPLSPMGAKEARRAEEDMRNLAAEKHQIKKRLLYLTNNTAEGAEEHDRLYARYKEIKETLDRSKDHVVGVAPRTEERESAAAQPSPAQLKAEKRQLQIALHSYRAVFMEQNSRPIRGAEDYRPVAGLYARYMELKAALAQ